MKIEVKPIGFVQNNRSKVEDDNWDSFDSVIELSDEFNEEAFYGLNEFSHVEVIYYFHKVNNEKIEYKARHPRNNKDFPLVGIFSQRGKNRPNKIGITTAKIIKVEGKKIFLKGLDAINGTPVLDIKPTMIEFLPREEIEQPNWSKEIMSNYWEAHK